MLDTMRGSSNESQKEQLFSLLNCALQDDELYKVIQVGTWSYWVSIGRYWLILGGNGTVQGGAGWYLVVLGQYKAVLVGIWWYWVSINWYCLCEVLLG